MVDKPGYSRSEAIRHLFGVELSEHRGLKESVTGLCRYEVSKGRPWIQQAEVPIDFGKKSHWFLPEEELTKLHNAVLLLGFGLKPKRIFEIFSSIKERFKWGAATRLLVEGRPNVGEIGFLPLETRLFFEQMQTSGFDLGTERLSNPFLALPQTAKIEGNTLVDAILLQGVMAPLHEQMLAHFIQGDIERAWQASQRLDNSPPGLNQLTSLIEKEYASAQELSNYLDSIPGLCHN